MNLLYIYTLGVYIILCYDVMLEVPFAVEILGDNLYALGYVLLIRLDVDLGFLRSLIWCTDAGEF